ncbi:MAG: hypothetical protein R2759_05565 [Bacteroidales bacterium]
MITIRESVFNDTSVIADFQQKMAFETEDIYLDNNKVRAGVNAVMEDKSKGFYIVAEEGRLWPPCC